MVEDGAFSHEIDYVTFFLNPEGHPNRFTGSKVTAILLNGWILPVGVASSGRVFACSLYSSLFLKLHMSTIRNTSLFLGLHVVNIHKCGGLTIERPGTDHLISGPI